MAEIIIKNSARNVNEDIAEHVYVPQYRLLGINPEQRDFGKKEAPPQGDFKIPNVGNTEETFWTSSLPDNNKEKSEETYFLIAKDKLIMAGTLKEVQSVLEKVFYQEEGGEKFDFTIDDVTVLKKMKIKIGIFVE